MMDRKKFLKTSALTALTIASVSCRKEVKAEKLSIRKYKAIGKTGLKMSDISMGCGKLPAASMVLRAIDRGINYFDTAPDYGASEDYIGQAMKRINRKKIILTSKFCRPTRRGHLLPGSRKRDYIAAVENSLTRMKTDYLDICFVHSLGSLSKKKNVEMKRLLDEEMLAAVEHLKRTGKIRFLGATSHGPYNMEELLLAAVKSGHFDLIMPAFNFFKFPRIPTVIREASKRGVGVVAMKTLAGARDMELDTGGEDFAPAAFKWVLKHPEVNGLVITIRTVSDLNNYLRASGKRFEAYDRRLIDSYVSRFTRKYCRTGCSDCESSCSGGVEVANIMRYQMYFRDYGMEKRGIESYGYLTKNSAGCRDCTVNSCSGACPHGLQIKEQLAIAHDALTMKA